MRRIKTAIITKMPIKGYSGGRYHAYILGCCLAEAGDEVYYIMDTIPQFVNDFKYWHGRDGIHYVLCMNYNVSGILPNDLRFDFVIIVPDLDRDDVFYHNSESIIRRYGGRPIVLNFETPNWYNVLLPNGRDLEALFHVKEIVHNYNGIVLSSAEESKKFAKEYYGDDGEIEYMVWNPAINTIEADRSGVFEKEKQIICMIRLSDKHKGGDDLLEIFAQPLQGYTLAFIVGKNKIDKAYMDRLNMLSKEFGFNIKLLNRLSDYEKFVELKKSRILIFPSKFEGFGYPPVEARYCNTVCITYDLPVLKEINREDVVYCTYGKVNEIKEELKKQLQLFDNGEVLLDFKLRTPNCIESSKRLHDLLEYINQEGDYNIRNNCDDIVWERYHEADKRIRSFTKYLVGKLRLLKE